MKKLILILFMCSAGYNSFSSDNLFGEPEDISCENLPESFKKYDEDRNLNQNALKDSLAGTVKFLKEHAKNKISGAEVLKFTRELEGAVSLSEANQFALTERADNISFAFTQCQ